MWKWPYLEMGALQMCSVQWGHTSLGWGLNQWLVSLQEQRQPSHDDRSRDWSYTNKCQRTRIAATTRSWKRQEGILPQSLGREGEPSGTLTWDFWPSKLERIYFCCIKPPGLCYFILATPRNSYLSLSLTSLGKARYAWRQILKKRYQLKTFGFFPPALPFSGFKNVGKSFCFSVNSISCKIRSLDRIILKILPPLNLCSSKTIPK